MAIEVITEFIAGATVRVIAYIYDDDGDLINPTTAKVTIIDATDATKATASSMSEAATGIYEYYHNTTTDSEKGDWRGQVDIACGTKTDIVAFGFKVK